MKHRFEIALVLSLLTGLIIPNSSQGSTLQVTGFPSQIGIGESIFLTIVGLPGEICTFTSSTGTNAKISIPATGINTTTLKVGGNVGTRTYNISCPQSGQFSATVQVGLSVIIRPVSAVGLPLSVGIGNKVVVVISGTPGDACQLSSGLNIPTAFVLGDGGSSTFSITIGSTIGIRTYSISCAKSGMTTISTNVISPVVTPSVIPVVTPSVTPVVTPSVTPVVTPVVTPTARLQSIEIHGINKITCPRGLIIKSYARQTALVNQPLKMGDWAEVDVVTRKILTTTSYSYEGYEIWSYLGFSGAVKTHKEPLQISLIGTCSIN